MFQAHYQTIRPLTTAHLAQTMTLLNMTTEELEEHVLTQVASNPALELVEERRCPVCHRLLPPKGPCPTCSQPASSNSDDPVVFLSPREDFYMSGGSSSDEIPEDTYSSAQDDLPTYVMKQIAPELAADERQIAAYLLTHLDEDGLLTISLMEAARYYHVFHSKVEGIQRIIQRADPIGVGSCSTRESLLVQLDVLSETKPVPDLARYFIADSMELVTHRQYAELAKIYRINYRQVQQIIHFIGENLNPFPARSYWGDVRDPTDSEISVYHRPDIIISYLNDDPKNPLLVEIISPVSGTLRINPLFRKAIQEASENKKEDWKNDLDQASLFVKCLQQRNHTMQRLMQSVVKIQKNYILYGEKQLKSLTRAQISLELSVHESTISRAVAGKTVQLPNKKIIPLASFFDRSLNVRTILKDIIANEPHPLNDNELVDLLAKQGYSVARRTVAKYRSMEGILPAHLRQSTITLMP
jgi:RNA polymerase sigma-54 factor